MKTTLVPAQITVPTFDVSPQAAEEVVPATAVQPIQLEPAVPNAIATKLLGKEPNSGEAPPSQRFRSVLDIQIKGFDKGNGTTFTALRDALVAKKPELAEELAQIEANPAKLEALAKTDLVSGKTTLDHLMKLLNGPLQDAASNKTADVWVMEQLRHVGTPVRADYSYGKCYSRTINAVWGKFQPAEHPRIVASLLVDGQVELASGINVKWDVATHPSRPGPALDFLFGALCNQLKAKVLPDPVVLAATAEYAYKGEMANLMTRLTGQRHVNVQFGEPQTTGTPEGRAAALHERLVAASDAMQRTGPWLAEFGSYLNHGGALHSYNPDTKQMVSYENAGEITQQTHIGYAVMPKAEADKLGMTVLTYPDDDERGYLAASSLKNLAE